MVILVGITTKRSRQNVHDKMFTTKRSPTKLSLTNGSRQMAHDEWLELRLGLGLGLELGLGVTVRVSEPFVVNHFFVNQLLLNVLSWILLVNVIPHRE